MKAIRCVFALFLIAFSTYPASASTCFDDQALAQLTPKSDSQRPMLIYVWSPRMVYSLHNMAVASQVAAEAGMAFLALHDMRVPFEELRSTNAPNSHPLCAPELLKRQALRHFPTAFVLTSQGIHAHPIVGAMPLAAWQLSLSERLAH